MSALLLPARLGAHRGACEHAPSVGMVMTRRPVVAERWAVARSGHTSCGSASCSSFPCMRAAVSQGRRLASASAAWHLQSALA